MKWQNKDECRRTENMPTLEPILQPRGQLAQYDSDIRVPTLKTETTSKLPTGNSTWTYAMTKFMLWHCLGEFQLSQAKNVAGNESAKNLTEQTTACQCMNICLAFYFISTDVHIMSLPPPSPQCKIREVQRKRSLCTTYFFILMRSRYCYSC